MENMNTAQNAMKFYSIKTIKNTWLMKTKTLKILEEKKSQRSKCLVYTRVMGYHRPVESFNIGKKGEHQQRTHFEESIIY
ncbi:hypothetical protein D3C80_1619110 [compost metagenome]